MNTNVQITLSDEERNALAVMLDGKLSKRMISRKEVTALCQQHIGGLLEQQKAEEEAKRSTICQAMCINAHICQSLNGCFALGSCIRPVGKVDHRDS